MVCHLANRDGKVISTVRLVNEALNCQQPFVGQDDGVKRKSGTPVEESKAILFLWFKRGSHN